MISYYELLGLIREDKQPDKIKLDGAIYNWNGRNYYSKDESEHLSSMIDEISMFNKNIEIIEEKPKKIEKLAVSDYEETFSQFELDVIASINRLIDRTDYLLEEDKHE